MYVVRLSGKTNNVVEADCSNQYHPASCDTALSDARTYTYMHTTVICTQHTHAGVLVHVL